MDQEHVFMPDCSSSVNLTMLKGMSGKELREVHQSGWCPGLDLLKGPVDGCVLGRSLLARLRIWRGKRFVEQSSEQDVLTGVNRLAIGPFKWVRYHFSGRIQPSRFCDQLVLFLDHDKPGNPAWVRSFHDEVVQVGERLYLGQSHVWVKDRLIFAGYFALVLGD
jgi:hypothetical protein